MEYEWKTYCTPPRSVDMSEEQKKMFREGDILYVFDGKLTYAGSTIPNPPLPWYKKLLSHLCFWK